jgi:hypothetical protein
MDKTLNRYEGFENLLSHGVCIFPVWDPAKLEEQFDESLKEQAELKHINPPDSYVGGGFGALGNASSFHTNFARKIRKKAYKAIITALASEKIQLPEGFEKVEIVPDRQSFRPAGVVPTAEAWHRDMTPLEFCGRNSVVKMCAEDMILGGWVNCNRDRTQTFACVPDSHNLQNGIRRGALGFHVISKSDHAEFERDKVEIAIPPGYGMCFRQETVHTVYAKKLTFDLKRIYIAFRFSKEATVPLITDIVERFQTGAVLPLKSGQMPQMIPILWRVNWPDKWIELSKRFPDYMKEEKELLHKRLSRPDVPYQPGTHLVLSPVAPAVRPQKNYKPGEIALYLPHAIQDAVREVAKRKLVACSSSIESETDDDALAGVGEEGQEENVKPMKTRRKRARHKK